MGYHVVAPKNFDYSLADNIAVIDNYVDKYWTRRDWIGRIEPLPLFREELNNYNVIEWSENAGSGQPYRQPIYAIWILNGEVYVTLVAHDDETGKYYIIQPKDANGVGAELVGIVGYYCAYPPGETLPWCKPALYTKVDLSDWVLYPVLDMTFKNGKKLTLYVNPIPVVPIVVTVLAIAAVGVTSWGISSILHASAENANAQANLIKAQNEATAIQLAKDVVDYVKTADISKEEKVMIINNALATINKTIYSNYAIENPPRETDDKSTVEQKQQSWLNQLIDFVKNNWIGIVGIFGFLLVLWKFKLWKRLYEMIDELWESRRR